MRSSPGPGARVHRAGPCCRTTRSPVETPDTPAGSPASTGQRSRIRRVQQRIAPCLCCLDQSIATRRWGRSHSKRRTLESTPLAPSRGRAAPSPPTLRLIEGGQEIARRSPGRGAPTRSARPGWAGRSRGLGLPEGEVAATSRLGSIVSGDPTSWCGSNPVVELCASRGRGMPGR